MCYLHQELAESYTRYVCWCFVCLKINKLFTCCRHIIFYTFNFLCQFWNAFWDFSWFIDNYQYSATVFRKQSDINGHKSSFFILNFFAINLGLCKWHIKCQKNVFFLIVHIIQNKIYLAIVNRAQNRIFILNIYVAAFKVIPSRCNTHILRVFVPILKRF